MNWKKVKPQEIKLVDIGIDFEPEVVDTNLQAILFRTEAGLFRISAGQYSGIDFSLPAPPPEEDAYHIQGVVCGIAVSEYYKSSYEAERRFCELDVVVGPNREANDEKTLTQTKVKVPVGSVDFKDDVD